MKPLLGAGGGWEGGGLKYSNLNIKGLHHQAANIQLLENFSFRRLKSVP